MEESSRHPGASPASQQQQQQHQFAGGVKKPRLSSESPATEGLAPKNGPGVVLPPPPPGALPLPLPPPPPHMPPEQYGMYLYNMAVATKNPAAAAWAANFAAAIKVRKTDNCTSTHSYNLTSHCNYQDGKTPVIPGLHGQTNGGGGGFRGHPSQQARRQQEVSPPSAAGRAPPAAGASQPQQPQQAGYPLSSHHQQQRRSLSSASPVSSGPPPLAAIGRPGSSSGGLKSSPITLSESPLHQTPGNGIHRGTIKRNFKLFASKVV